MSYAPIALFVYRRPEHARRTLESLLACPELADSPLHIFCDGASAAEALEAVRETRRVVRALAPTSAVFVERERNLGLAASIISGVTELCRTYGKTIVVEDDLELSPAFLRFLNEGLDRYAGDDVVMQVSGYQFPMQPPLSRSPRFFSFPTSWGWATWERAWKHFDEHARGYTRLRDDVALRRRFDLDGAYPYFDMLRLQRAGRIDSWAIRWHLSVCLRRGLALYPGRSLVRNNGLDGSGTHGDSDRALAGSIIGDEHQWGAFPPVELDTDAQARVSAFLSAQRHQSWLSHARKLLSTWWRRLF